MNNALARGLLKAGLVTEDEFKHAERYKAEQRVRDIDKRARDRRLAYEKEAFGEAMRALEAIASRPPSPSVGN